MSKEVVCMNSEKHTKVELVQVSSLLFAIEQLVCTHSEWQQSPPPPALAISALDFSSNIPFKTAGSFTISFASPSMCTSLPVINSLRRRLPRSLLWIEGDSSLLYCSYRGYFFPSLPLFTQIMLPGAASLAQQAEAVFYLRFLYFCSPNVKTKSSVLVFLLSQIQICILLYTTYILASITWHLQLLNTAGQAIVNSINSDMLVCMATTSKSQGDLGDTLWIIKYVPCSTNYYLFCHHLHRKGYLLCHSGNETDSSKYPVSEEGKRKSTIKILAQYKECAEPNERSPQKISDSLDLASVNGNGNKQVDLTSQWPDMTSRFTSSLLVF